MATGIDSTLAAIDSALEDCTVSSDAMRSNPDAGRVICDGGGELWPERQLADGWPSSWMRSAAFHECGGSQWGQWGQYGTLGMAEVDAASQTVERMGNLVRVRVTVDPSSLPRGGFCKVLFTEPIHLEAGTHVLIETYGIPGSALAPAWLVEQDCTLTALWCS